MKCLVIGGNRFVGLRLCLLLQELPGLELNILNRTGQAPHCPKAIVHKGDRRQLEGLFLEHDWDMIFDFACFNAAEAVNAVGFFKKVGRYVFISSASVYDEGANLTEGAFMAETMDLSLGTDALNPGNAYQDGKRRAEAVFAQKAKFPVLSVRFPFILGPDDYTERLEFHVQHLRNAEPMYFPDLKARTSMIHAEDAARFLIWTMQKRLSGPLNVASTAPISLDTLVAQLELLLETKRVLAAKPDARNCSPYGCSADWFMNTAKLQKAGFTAAPILDWLPELVRTPGLQVRKGYVH